MWISEGIASFALLSKSRKFIFWLFVVFWLLIFDLYVLYNVLCRCVERISDSRKRITNVSSADSNVQCIVLYCLPDQKVWYCNSGRFRSYSIIELNNMLNVGEVDCLLFFVFLGSCIMHGRIMRTRALFFARLMHVS